MKQKIIELVSREIGFTEALVVNAALEIARVKWSETNTILYGEAVKEALEEMIKD